MIAFGPLGFLQPWFLLGLIALPILWYLLRLIPPQPNKIWFPPLRLLAGLQAKDRQPDKSPLWILLLRMFLIALVIMAFSRPIWLPKEISEGQALDTLVVLDNGWASAANWAERKNKLSDILSDVEQRGKKVLVVRTSYDPEQLNPDEDLIFDHVSVVNKKISGVSPTPYRPERKKTLKLLNDHLNNTEPLRVVWLSDGIDYTYSRQFSDGLKKLAGQSGVFEIHKSIDRSALGLFASRDAKGIRAKLVRTGGGAKEGVVYAWNAKGEQLGEKDFVFKKGAESLDITLTMPLALRNEVTKITVAGESSAGSVYLLDSRSLRSRIGLLSGEDSDVSQPLLSPMYYIEKALRPYVELVVSREKNISVAISDLLNAKPSVLILADVGALREQELERLKIWVERGGVLVRFAGASLEQQGDSLLPVGLRQGGRTLGGALSWGKPQGLSDFERNSPFYGLVVKPEVTVKRQVLADPTLLSLGGEVWSRLQDGTPLVTARKLKQGRLILFHITANSEWSNLPISGLFVDMLRRISDLSRPGLLDDENGTADKSKQVYREKLLAPYLVMNGFGELYSPNADVKPINYREALKGRLSYGVPPGYYGSADAKIAMNVIKTKTLLVPQRYVPSGAIVSGYKSTSSFVLFPWFIMGAFLLLMLDACVWIAMNWRKVHFLAEKAAVFLVFFFLLACFSPAGFAQNKNKAEQDFALKASTGTHLAYVLTGNSEIDRVSKFGLSGLSRVIAARTAVEPAEPIAVNLEKDELAFFPVIYWPIDVNAKSLSDKVLAKVDAYMRLGGMVIFDTRDFQSRSYSLEGNSTPGMKTLRRLVGRLNIPRLAPVTEGHVVTKSFYLLKSFPGRWEGGQLWVEASTYPAAGDQRRARRADGVSSILVTSNDFAGAWALDENNRPMLPIVPGGDFQREMAFRTGVNIVMYALTGNYKADQVHVPALLERLGQ